MSATPNEGCQWLVRKASGNPEPDSIEDTYVEVPCGDPVVAGARYPMCEYHLEPMTMALTDFERVVEEGVSWSGLER